jgi:hypothetical protein
MFVFGKPEDTAQLFREEALRSPGPSLPDRHWKEMEERDLRNAFTYLYRAVRSAHEEGVGDEVLEVLLLEYDEVFKALAETSDSFKRAVSGNRHQPVLGTTREQVDKYKKLAGV